MLPLSMPKTVRRISGPSLIAGLVSGKSCYKQLQPVATLRISRSNRSCAIWVVVIAEPGYMQRCSMQAAQPRAARLRCSAEHACCVPRKPQNRQGLEPAFPCVRPVPVKSLLPRHRIDINSTGTPSDPGVTAPKVIATMHAQARMHPAQRCQCSLLRHDGCV